jgi:uncharacterized membrane protein (DUF485 family)
MSDAINENTSRQIQNPSKWDRIAASKQFKDLLVRKKSFIAPVFIFFFIYYFALPISVGYAPKLMSTRVIGTVTLAYLFALSQFVVGWTIAWFYMKAAAKFDKRAKDILSGLDDGPAGS